MLLRWGVAAPALLEILNHLRSTAFRDVAGSRVTAAIPVSERLINELIAATMPRNLPVREVSVRPEANNRFSVRLTPRASMLPPLTLKLDIERQPEFPASPVLVLRMATMGGLFGLAGAALPLDKMMPPGVRLEGERILVDLRAMAAQHGFGEYVAFVRNLKVSTEAGFTVLHIDAGIS